MCEFSCDRDFESCFTTIPEIRAQLLMAAEPNICEGRLIPLTGGSWVVAALDGPHILASKLQNIFKFVPKWRHFTSSSNSSAPYFSLALSMWGETDSSNKNGQPHFPIFTCCGTSKKSSYKIPLQGRTMKIPTRTYLTLEYLRKCVKVCSSKNIPACTCLGIYPQQRHMSLHTKYIGFRIILCRNTIQ